MFHMKWTISHQFIHLKGIESLISLFAGDFVIQMIRLMIFNTNIILKEVDKKSVFEAKVLPVLNDILDKDVVFTNTCCFEGMLLHVDLIRKAGVPDERFFQVNGDTVYGFVLSLYTNIVHVKAAVIHRLLTEKKPKAIKLKKNK